MANKLSLNFLGSSFDITVDEDEAYLQKVLAQYEAAVENTRCISGINEPINIAILTGFMLCDEINRIKQRFDEEISGFDRDEAQEVQDRTLRLISKLDQALKLAGG